MLLLYDRKSPPIGGTNFHFKVGTFDQQKFNTLVMKKILLLSIISASVSLTNAGTITVSNNPNSPGQYTDIQTAANNANDGDTLLVAGSPTQYSGATITDKEIHIVGIGYNPNKQTPYPTSINTMYLGVMDNTFNANGSSIEGCDIFSLTTEGNWSSAISIDMLAIRRCSITSFAIGDYLSNLIVHNNIIGEIGCNGVNTTGIIVNNNIITTQFSNPQNVTMTNNLFIAPSGSVFTGSFLNNCLIANNIFYGISPYATNATFCTFNNNLSYNTSNDNFYTLSTNTGSGNFVGQDPNFVSESDYTYQDTDDFNVNAGSPVINAGTDGTDLGIYGGLIGWEEGGTSGSGFMYSQEPQFPQVNQMNIQNSVIPVNGTLNVQVKGIINQ